MAEQEARGQAIDLRLVLKALRRHRGLLVVAATVGALVGAVIATLTPVPYVSTSVVLLASQSDSGVFDEATYVELVQSKPVLQQAIGATDAALTIDELAPAVTAVTPSPTLLEIDVAHPDSAVAADLSAAVADSFVAFLDSLQEPLTGRREADLEEQIAALETQASQVDEELAAARERQAQLADDAQRVREAQLSASLTAERSDLAVKIATLQDNLASGTDSADLPLGVNARVIDSGDAPVRPSQAVRGVLGGVIGAGLGFVLAATIALYRTRQDRALRSSQALARVLGAPIVAGLQARPQRSPEGWRSMLGSLALPPAEIWSVRRMLRWLAHSHDGTPTVMMISFSTDRDGQSIGPLVAATAASLGLRTSITAVGDARVAASLSAGLSIARRKGGSREGLEITPTPFESSFDLRILLTVVDPLSASFASTPKANAHLLCVGPGVATIDDLSRLVLALDAADRVVAGVLLANPAEWDDIAAPWLPTVDDDSHSQAMVPPPTAGAGDRKRGDSS